MIWYFLPIILALGLITSYTDIKYGKIKNRHVTIAIILGIAMNVALIIYYKFASGINQNYVYELITNVFFSAAVGFGLWHFNVWSAADGKLFIAFSLLVPLDIYVYGYQKYFPAIILLANIFVISFLIMVLFMIKGIKKKYLKEIGLPFIKEFFDPKKLMISVISLFGIYWILSILLPKIGFDSYILRFIFSMFVFSWVKKKLGEKMIYPMIAIAILRIIIDKSIYSIPFLLNFLFLILAWQTVFGFLSGGFSKLSYFVFSKRIHVNELKEGMILSDMIEKKEKITEKEAEFYEKNHIDFVRKKKAYYILKQKTEGENFLKESSEGLTKKQINMIKNLGFVKIRIGKTLPFAPFIFLGTIFTIIAKGNILILVKNLF